MASRAERTPRATRPRRPPLPPDARRAARSAGGWGLSLCSAGVNLVVALSAVAVVVAIARWFLLSLVEGSDGVEEAVAGWLASIDPTPWIVTVVVVLLVAAGVVALGALTSVRILRRAGIAEAVSITWWCCGVGTVVQAGLSIVASVLTTVLGLLTGGLGLGIVVLLYLATSTALTAVVGYLAGPRLWMGRTQRVLARRTGDGAESWLVPDAQRGSMGHAPQAVVAEWPPADAVRPSADGPGGGR